MGLAQRNVVLLVDDMADVVYRFSSEQDERVARDVRTYADVKKRISEDCMLRKDRTRLVLKFDDDVNENTPIDEKPVERTRRLIVQRLPPVFTPRASPKSDTVEDILLEKFPSARSAKIKTTGQPTPSLFAVSDSLETCRRARPFDASRWNDIRGQIYKLLKSHRGLLYTSDSEWPYHARWTNNHREAVLNSLRQIQFELHRNPREALELFHHFRTAHKGTVYTAKYCGRKKEVLIALERIFYGLFEQDF